MSFLLKIFIDRMAVYKINLITIFFNYNIISARYVNIKGVEKK